MSNVVFILGAGASKQSGAPLMADFLDVAADLLLSKKVEDKRAEFERVFSAIGNLQAVHSKAQLNLNNIESVFTVLELGKIIQRVPGLSVEEIPAAIGALKELIVKTLEVTMEFPMDPDRGEILAPKLYEQFAETLTHLQRNASPKRTASVITFNYDIAVDMAMFRAGLGPNYILHAPPSIATPMDLMKLHGSLNWATEVAEPKRIRPMHLARYLQLYRARPGSRNVQVPIGTHLVEYFAKYEPPEVEREPVIVPPSWNKADYHTALSDVWAAAARHLSEAEYIFIIGYSLTPTDSFFRHLYALGSVGDAPLRRIIVFNPDDSGKTDGRFRKLLGPGAIARYDYQQRTFDDANRYIYGLFANRM